MAEETVQPFPWTTLSKDSVTWEQRTCLIYAPSGCGKTFLAAQEFPRPLFLSCDPGQTGGVLSAKEFGVKFVKISSYQQLMNLLPTLKEQAGKEFDTVVVDSISYLSRMVMQAILATSAREIPRFEEWNLNAERIRRLINTIGELNCHIVFTAVDDISKDETTGKMFGGPALPGKLSKELPQAVDVVLRLYTQTSYDSTGKLVTTYKFRCVPDDVWFAKDRTRTLPSEGVTKPGILASLFTQKG